MKSVRNGSFGSGTHPTRLVRVLQLCQMLAIGIALIVYAPKCVARWVNVGPPGGQFFSIAVDPSNSGRVFVGGQSGMFATSNGGVTWQHIGRSLRYERDVQAIAIDPARTNVVFAALRDGMYKSIDRGSAWTRVRDEPTQLAIAVAPSGQVVFAGSARGIAKSDDGGQTWFRLVAGLPEQLTAVRTIAIVTDRPDTIFIGSYDGVFKSTDAGTSWRRVLNRPYVRTVVVDQNRPSVVYAGTDELPGYGFKSVDGGENWFPIANECGVVSSFITNPDNALDVIVHCELGLLRSMDGGSNWSVINTAGQPERYAFGALARGTNQPGTLYGSFGNGMLKSIDNGSNWEWLRTPSQQEVLSLKANVNGGIVAGTTYFGTFVSSPQAVNWSAPNGGLAAYASVAAVAVHPIDSARLIAAVSYPESERGIYSSANGGVLWTPSVEGVPEGFKVTFVEFDASAPEVAFAGSEAQGLLSSRDGGRNWSRVGGIGPNAVLRAIAFSPMQPSRAFLVVGRSSILVSGDHGNTWASVGSPSIVAGDSIRSLAAVGPIGQELLFAGTERGSIYTSRDAGRTWIRTLATSSQIVSIAITPAGPRRIYAATKTGRIFLSLNGGQAWRNVGPPAASNEITSLVVIRGSPYFSTLGSGIFKLQ